MNPLTNMKNLQKLNERELKLGIAGSESKSWHQKYKDSAWIFVGGLPYELSEGDIISVFSQYGEIVNINLVRDKNTGKSRGFCFICFEDQRSTVLAVDNFNGIKILNRIIRVDHVEEYKVPKERGDEPEIVKKLHMEGCAPEISSNKVEKEELNLVKQSPKIEPHNSQSRMKEEMTDRKAENIVDAYSSRKEERYVSYKEIKVEKRSVSRSPQRAKHRQEDNRSLSSSRTDAPHDHNKKRHDSTFRRSSREFDKQDARREHSRHEESNHQRRHRYDDDFYVPRRYK